MKTQIKLLIILLIVPFALMGQPSGHTNSRVELFAKEFYIKKDINSAVSIWNIHKITSIISKKDRNDLLSSIKSIIESEYKVTYREIPYFRFISSNDTIFLYFINLVEVVNKNNHTLTLGMNQNFILVNNTNGSIEVLNETTFRALMKSLSAPITLDVAEYLSKLFFAFIKPGVGFCTKIENVFPNNSVNNQFSICKTESGFISKYKTCICLSRIQYNPPNVIHVIRFKNNGEYEYFTEPQ